MIAQLQTRLPAVALWHLPRRGAAALIRLYQRTLSPDHGPLAGLTTAGCRYYPSCSEYTVRAIHQNGLLAGSAQGAYRILRCNPFSAGGVDEPIKKI